MSTADCNPLLSVIIPARNEEDHLGHCLDALSTASAPFAGKVETIVILNRCTDRTEEIARSRGCVVVADGSKNLARIRNAGARAAKGKILVTVDADSVVSANMLTEIQRALESGNFVGGGVLILPSRWSVGIFLTALCLVPIALRHGISGGVFFCLKSDFDAVGGFNEELHSVEDIDFAVRLKAHGRKSGRKYANLFRARITTSCRKFDRLGDWYFLLHPWKFMELLRGHNQELANQVWYDFER